MSPVELETRSSKLETNHKELAQDIVRRAMNSGATAAECVIREGDEFSTLVRLGQVETLKESGSKAIGVRVFNGKRAASTYSSDFSREGLDRMLKSALELSRITSEDPYAGIPEPEQLGSISGDLDLYYADVYSLPGEERISYARRTEKADSRRHQAFRPLPHGHGIPSAMDSSQLLSHRSRVTVWRRSLQGRRRGSQLGRALQVTKQHRHRPVTPVRQFTKALLSGCAITATGGVLCLKGVGPRPSDRAHPIRRPLAGRSVPQGAQRVVDPRRAELGQQAPEVPAHAPPARIGPQPQ